MGAKEEIQLVKETFRLLFGEGMNDNDVLKELCEVYHVVQAKAEQYLAIAKGLHMKLNNLA